MGTVAVGGVQGLGKQSDRDGFESLVESKEEDQLVVVEYNISHTSSAALREFVRPQTSTNCVLFHYVGYPATVERRQSIHYSLVPCIHLFRDLTHPSPRSALTNQIKVGKQRIGPDILARNRCLEVLNPGRLLRLIALLCIVSVRARASKRHG